MRVGDVQYQRRTSHVRRRASVRHSASPAIAPTGGHGRASPDATGLEALTERELQVARLVVDRKTNPEIAAELFLSPKTVQTDVSHIFHKMDVASRVALARAVERADRTASARPSSRPLHGNAATEPSTRPTR
jgi:DNA-binding NarL/FixJ family response regulator